MKKYKEAPWWWYIILLVLSFLAGLYTWRCFVHPSDSNPILLRFNRCYQRTDHTSLVVVYRRFDPGNTRYGKVIS